MRYLTLAIVFVTVGSCEGFAQRAVVCPPNLSYCYEKPVLPRMTAQDEYRQLKAELDRDLAAVESRARSADYGLRYQLGRAQFCNSIRQDGC